MKQQFDNNCLDIIVPIKFEMDWPTTEEIVETLRFQKKHYGITRFNLGAPSLGWKTVGYPPMSHFEELGRMFARIREAVKADGISCGFLNMLTIRCGDSFDPVIRLDGTAVKAAACPLDPNYQKAFAGSNARFCEIAKPDFIFFEDDYSLNAQSRDGFGCCCEHHLRAFAQRCGKYYTREELVAAASEKTPEGYALLKKWRELQKDSMVALSRAVRTEVDKYNPQIPIGFMQAINADRDGDMTEAVSRALAGPNHTPFCRLYGTIYMDVANAKHVPEILYHTMYSKQHINGDFCFYHESDTYPHTRFYLSAKKIRTFMAGAYSMGFDGSTFQTAQILDDRNEEHAYGLMYKRERERFNAMSRVAKQCAIRGVQICYDPFWNTLEAASVRPYWTRSVSMFGMPYTTLDSEVAFWDRCQAQFADHETVIKYLSRGLFLDGAAAKILCLRGYSQYLGVEMGEDIAERLANDDGAREVIAAPFDRYSRGKNMPAANVYAGGKSTPPLAIRVIDAKVEVITQVCNFRKEVVCPGMVRFENELGGKIVILGVSMEKNLSHTIYNYRRQKLFHEMVKWCSDSFVFVENAPNIYTIMNEAVEPEKCGFMGMLTLCNLGEDPVEGAMLHLPPQWKSANFKLLDRYGQWQPVDWERTETGLIIGCILEHCDPVYILVE